MKAFRLSVFNSQNIFPDLYISLYFWVKDSGFFISLFAPTAHLIYKQSKGKALWSFSAKRCGGYKAAILPALTAERRLISANLPQKTFIEPIRSFICTIWRSAYPGLPARPSRFRKSFIPARRSAEQADPAIKYTAGKRLPFQLKIKTLRLKAF